jgi:membrane-associated phospholipid phosphatase
LHGLVSRYGRWIRCAGVSIALGVSAPAAFAQHPKPDQGEPAELDPAAPAAPVEAAPPPAGSVSNDAATDELVGQLLSQGGEGQDDDLKWLYSDLEEYSPSGLVGKPIPAPAFPERGEGSRRSWDPSWRRFALGNYILTGAALAIAGGSALIPEAPDRWRGKNGFDESVRDSIGIEDYDGGQWARDVSDVLLAISVMNPLLIDSLVITYWYRRSEDVAAQMALISAEALGVASAFQGVTSGFSSRERPYGRNCGGSLDARLDDCESSKRYRSFFSGHTALSFAGAGVSCSHHLRHRVFGNTAADAVACGVALTGAGVVGTMRVVGDQHYATDVLMGAAVGTLSGLGVPWLLHYGPLARAEAGARAPAVRLTLVPMGNGLGVAGKF